LCWRWLAGGGWLRPGARLWYRDFYAVGDNLAAVSRWAGCAGAGWLAAAGCVLAHAFGIVIFTPLAITSPP
ncbi:hypothetical protein G7B21_29360, partial [Klebsiella pneumoniae]|nr:hypothetical protein [Klebsiella pneumoniae]